MSSFQRSQATTSAPSNYLRVLRERWLIVLLTILVCVTAGVLSERSTAKKYSAQSDLLISPVDNSDPDLRGDQRLPEHLLRPDLQRPHPGALPEHAGDRPDLVRRNLHLRQSAGSLLGMISVQPLSQTDIVSVRASATSAVLGSPPRQRIRRRDDHETHATGAVGCAEGRHQIAGADQPERLARVAGSRSRAAAPRRPQVADRAARPERRRAQPRGDGPSRRIRSRPSSSSWRRPWPDCCSASGSRCSQTRSAGRSAARTTWRPGPASRSWRGCHGSPPGSCGSTSAAAPICRRQPGSRTGRCARTCFARPSPARRR